jgi:hypothetical protein
LQIFHHTLNVIARLGQRDAFYPIDRIHFGIARIAVLRHPLPNCVSAWNKDPVSGVIGIQSGPPG